MEAIKQQEVANFILIISSLLFGAIVLAQVILRR